MQLVKEGYFGDKSVVITKQNSNKFLVEIKGNVSSPSMNNIALHTSTFLIVFILLIISIFHISQPALQYLFAAYSIGFILIIDLFWAIKRNKDWRLNQIIEQQPIWSKEFFVGGSNHDTPSIQSVGIIVKKKSNAEKDLIKSIKGGTPEISVKNWKDIDNIEKEKLDFRFYTIVGYTSDNTIIPIFPWRYFKVYSLENELEWVHLGRVRGSVRSSMVIVDNLQEMYPSLTGTTRNLDECYYFPNWTSKAKMGPIW